MATAAVSNKQPHQPHQPELTLRTQCQTCGWAATVSGFWAIQGAQLGHMKDSPACVGGFHNARAAEEPEEETPDENDRHIRYLTDKLLGEFARPQGVLDADAVRRAIPFGAADERCRHGVRYGAYCPDCAASEGIRRGRVA